MKNALSSILYLLLTMPLCIQAEPRQITVCIDQGWFPFTYTEGNQVKGIHVDMIKQAAKQSGYDMKFIPMPWKRCLIENLEGRLDGVVSASYKESRAEYLHYPQDAGSERKSSLRVMQVEYVAVTDADIKYQYDGKLENLPEPVRIPAGYSIGEELKTIGLDVDDSSTDDQSNIKKLLRDKTGSVIVIPELAMHILELTKATGELGISQEAIKSKSYFAAFSKKSKLGLAEIQKLWRHIAEIRDNPSLMDQITQRHQPSR